MQALFCCLPGALRHGKAENNERINMRKITHETQNILSRLRRELKKRKQKPKNSKSGLDTGGGYVIMPLKGKDLPFNLFWVSIFYTP